MFTPYDDRKSEIPFASAEYISFASRNSFLGCPAVTMDEMGDGDVVILKVVNPPSEDEFRKLVSKARRQARKAGMKKSDVDAAVRKIRGRR